MRTILKLVTAAALLLVAAGAQAQNAVRDATPKELTAIKADLETKLKDAASAKFQNVKVQQEGNFCGLLNSKNSYGAYAGYTPFMGMVFKDTTGKQLAAVLAVDEPEITRAMCAEKGLPLPPG